MSDSLESIPLKYRSNSDYLASLPPWRRLLARLNWHPVRETEIETWRLRSENAQRKIETERIRKEAEQIRKETEQLRLQRIRAEQLDAQIEALFCSDAFSSTPAATTDADSTPS